MNTFCLILLCAAACLEFRCNNSCHNLSFSYLFYLHLCTSISACVQALCKLASLFVQGARKVTHLSVVRCTQRYVFWKRLVLAGSWPETYSLSQYYRAPYKGYQRWHLLHTNHLSFGCFRFRAVCFPNLWNCLINVIMPSIFVKITNILFFSCFLI